MEKIETTSKRFQLEHGFHITFQSPADNIQSILDHLLCIAPLEYGDYDRVAFTGAAGVQQFRSLGHGRNKATEDIIEVPCHEVSFFLPEDSKLLERVLEGIYHSHPYEEPVIFVSQSMRSLHVRGMDEDNPNRFWNKAAADWVPEAHREN